MAKKISQLTQATEVKSDDVTVIVQDGETKKLPLNMMVTKQDIENKKIAGLAKLDEIEATYENDTYTPTITVKNKSSVKVGEGDGVDYSANVMDGHVKSAILTGSTLVNLNKNPNIYKQLKVGESRYYVLDIPYNIKANQPFTLKLNVKESTVSQEIMLKSVHVDNTITYDVLKQGSETGIVNRLFTKGKDVNNIEIYLQATETGTAIIENIILLEGDYTNVDIPYFEGMQSVKMPVLTTQNSILSDIRNYTVKAGRSWEGKEELGYSELISFNGNNVVFKHTGSSIRGFMIQGIPYCSKGSLALTLKHKRKPENFDGTLFCNFTLFKDGVFVYQTGNIQLTYESNTNLYTFTTTLSHDFDSMWITMGISTGEVGEHEFEFVLSKLKTNNTEYKTNILTVNEEVELRGIGNVKDELDCLTGELTERIGEVVLNGSDDVIFNVPFDGVYEYELDGLASNMIITIPKTTLVNYGNPDYNGYYYTIENNIRIINHDCKSVSEFKQWLSQNPILIQYQLKTESVKTVDLMPSGTHPSTTPYCWKNGLIQLSSSGLLPNLEYSVVTSRAGQINQNATMIVKNDKRIFDLEILLAGGLVNTTYQALTLQNQVETGLSKVSLNSETEPDYLLYHMIMKLIEEKAYKLDDLTEKVSVFYLYEKLSDTQFETIYSALYPFVEDEIVEEPVVEELPEVVEDEVIM